MIITCYVVIILLAALNRFFSQPTLAVDQLVAKTDNAVLQTGEKSGGFSSKENVRLSSAYEAFISDIFKCGSSPADGVGVSLNVCNRPTLNITPRY